MNDRAVASNGVFLVFAAVERGEIDVVNHPPEHGSLQICLDRPALGHFM